MRDAILQAGLSYVAAGLSVIPIRAKTKRPHTSLLPAGSWAPYQRQAANYETVQRWVESDDQIGLGIVCGAVSGNLAVIDVDDQDFVRWLEEHGQKLLSQTWTVRTGSGKLHVYLRSQTPCATQVLRIGNKRVGELRSDGSSASAGPSYVVAPPSTHPSGDAYTTLYGEPRFIAEVGDVVKQIWQPIACWSNNGSGATASYRILDPLPDDQRRLLLQRIRESGIRSGRVYRAITSGAVAGEGEWKTAHSNSDVDFAVVAALREGGMGEEEIESVFANFPIGERCYRNAVRTGSYGLYYIRYTIANADASISRSREAAKLASGKNFTITSSVRVDYTDPTYDLMITHHDPGNPERIFTSGTVKIKHDELFSERMFEKAVSRTLGFLPQLNDCHRGKKYREFFDLILTMSRGEPVPEEATVEGHLRSTIVRMLQDRMLPEETPTEPGAFSLGWRDRDNGRLFIRGNTLLGRLNGMLSQAPGPEKVWEAVRSLGGTEKRVTIGTASERLWVISLKKIEAQ